MKPYYKSKTIWTNSVLVILAVLAGLFGSGGFFNALVEAMQGAGMDVDMSGLTLIITFLVSAINIVLRSVTKEGVSLKGDAW